MKNLFLALLIAPALWVDSAWARQDPVPVKRAIENFLRIQIQGLPGQASFTVGAIAEANQLAPCSNLDVSMAPGARAWGRSQVLVRCLGGGGWTMFVPILIKITGNYLVTARALTQGTVLSVTDFSVEPGELTALPNGVLLDTNQAIGRTLSVSLPAGRPLRGDMLRQAIVVIQNQNVKVISYGPGFSVANEGRAINNAAEGQVAQVRLGSGQVVSGIARAGGIVEIRF